MQDDDFHFLSGLALREEAERRVRGGQTRAEVARALRVPLPTMAQWAHAGGWRRKDLAREQAADLARQTALRISHGHVQDLIGAAASAGMEEQLAASALEDVRRVQAATRRLAEARLLLAEARKAQLAAINAAWGFDAEGRPLAVEGEVERAISEPDADV